MRDRRPRRGCEAYGVADHSGLRTRGPPAGRSGRWCLPRPVDEADAPSEARDRDRQISSPSPVRPVSPDSPRPATARFTAAGTPGPRSSTSSRTRPARAAPALPRARGGVGGETRAAFRGGSTGSRRRGPGRRGDRGLRRDRYSTSAPGRRATGSRSRRGKGRPRARLGFREKRPASRRAMARRLSMRRDSLSVSRATSFTASSAPAPSGAFRDRSGSP